MAVVEPELLAVRRAFPVAQALLAGVPVSRLAERVVVGWHGTETYPESGPVAVLQAGAGLDDLLGDVVLLTANGRQVFVHVRAVRGLPEGVALSISRRSFLALGLLSLESLECIVEVVG